MLSCRGYHWDTLQVGYCQGMSQIAALLLMYLNSDEDAFWALSQLMVGPKYNMHGFFIPSFPKLMRFQDHHDKVRDYLAPMIYSFIPLADSSEET